MAVKPSNPSQQVSLPATENSRSASSSSKENLEIVERVTETLKPLLKNPSEVRRVVTQVVSLTESYSGPTPHPEHLERIELIAPGSASKIIEMAIAEQRFRHRIALLTVLYPYLGLVLGFVIALACFYMAHLLGMGGKAQVATAMVGVSALGVIGWFIKSRLSGREEAETPYARKGRSESSKAKHR